MWPAARTEPAANEGSWRHHLRAFGAVKKGNADELAVRHDSVLKEGGIAEVAPLANVPAAPYHRN